MNTTLRKQYLSLIVSIALCLFAGVVLGIVLSKMKASFDSTNSLKEQLTSYQVNRKAFNEEAIQISSLQTRADLIESVIIKNSSVPGLLSSLEALSVSNNIKFEITSVQTVVDGDSQRLVIECDAGGSYEQVTSFFDLLQHQAFQIRFKQLSLFSETVPVVATEELGVPATNKPKASTLTNEVKWRGVATIEVVSFE